MRNVWEWVRHGWPVALAYVIAFFAMLSVRAWQPDVPHKERAIEIHASR
ncbi:MAG TPA: hypothetical protein VNW28_06450 [Chthoniobacterales bacterium]|jgi:hypothetical protein|nr:hypothetical protein [Chthoniobacterales bacterium]